MPFQYYVLALWFSRHVHSLFFIHTVCQIGQETAVATDFRLNTAGTIPQMLHPVKYYTEKVCSV